MYFRLFPSKRKSKESIFKKKNEGDQKYLTVFPSIPGLSNKEIVYNKEIN